LPPGELVEWRAYLSIKADHEKKALEKAKREAKSKRGKGW
jgi:hypothetical protein